MKLYLTFDCEDFINPVSTKALKNVLELLEKYDFKGIFFLTGHFCEYLESKPEILNLLQSHEIGYHTTAHSVRPALFEYTDIVNYDEACNLSLIRETSKINPLTGETEGKGGILTVQKVFSQKKVRSFRAPGFCWSPPHLDALARLGIKFDFSSNISQIPICYNSVTFYPFPILGFETLTSSILPFGNMKFTSMIRLMNKSIEGHPLVFFLHPHDFVNAEIWDRNYFVSNPTKLCKSKPRDQKEVETFLRSFELFLRRVQSLANKDILEVTPPLEEGVLDTQFTGKQIMRCYHRSVRWCSTFFNYNPTFLLNHFNRYFGQC